MGNVPRMKRRRQRNKAIKGTPDGKCERKKKLEKEWGSSYGEPRKKTGKA